MCRSILSLSKIANQMWHDHPFSQRNRTTERAVGVGNLGGIFIKYGGLAHLCPLCKETSKTSHPPITKPTNPFLTSPPFLAKIYHPTITAIFEKSHPPPPLYGAKGGGRPDYVFWNLMIAKNEINKVRSRRTLILIWKSKKWSLNRGTLVSVPLFVHPDTVLWF